MMYYGSKISDNLSTSPEGFLICHNVPIARTGYQEYLGSEFPPEMQSEYGIEPNTVYKVYRSPEEVFSPATIASFEGKPFTDNHPTEMVNTQNINMYGKGHIQNIRKGDGEFSNMLIADIICTAEPVSNSIKEKIKREVSCGYDYVMTKGPKGFEQKQIRGNHLALVENGRAGQKAAIQDSIPDAIINKDKKGETKKMVKKPTKNFLAALGLKHYVQDAEPEEIEQALSGISGDEEPTATAEPEGNTLAKDVQELKAAMADVTSTLKQLVESDKKVHAGLTDEEKLEQLEKGAMDDLTDLDADAEKKESEAVQNLIEAEQEETDEDIEEKKPAMDAAAKQLIKSMKPKLLAIPDPKVRAQAVDAFCAAMNDSMTVKPGKNDYARLQSAIKTNVAKDNAPKTISNRLTEQVNTINKYNPHMKGDK